jgi:serine/threonine-protein kinase
MATHAADLAIPTDEMKMPESWASRWTRQGGAVQGGQGQGFLGIASDGSGQRAFIKTLTRQRDRRARGRFLREVAAYETLAGTGVPVLLDHNAEAWEDLSQRLYLAIDYIDGGNLRDWVISNGPATYDQALGCAEAVAEVLTRGHERAVVHRDIKPANIMLCDGEPAKALLVDFGLSFDHAEDDDLTRIGEEVGNRFLRLPEHAVGGRSAVSDVTQLAGVVLFMLTGHEPRVLMDENSLMPHQREELRTVLETSFSGRTLRRLLAVFDKAFAVHAADRYGTAAQLVHDLKKVTMDPGRDDMDELDGLLARVDELTRTPDQQRLAELREVLTQALQVVAATVKRFALERRLKLSQSGHSVEVTAGTARAQTSLSVTKFEDATNFVAYRVEARGTMEFVLSVDGDEIWRGVQADESLERAVTLAAARAFVASQDDA